MPKCDGTGPKRKGSKAGRGQGSCNTAEKNPGTQRQGNGRAGKGRGAGQGRGQR